MQTTSYAELPKRSRYYQDVIDLNIIEKGDTYDILGVSYVIFICTFDFFKKDRSVYEFENICVEDANIRLNDGTHKIFLNTKGDRVWHRQGTTVVISTISMAGNRKVSLQGTCRRR